jgi:hypothetical protein
VKYKTFDILGCCPEYCSLPDKYFTAHRNYSKEDFMTNDRQLTFYFDEETAERLKALAERDGLSMSSWMRVFVRKYIRENTEQQLV